MHKSLTIPVQVIRDSCENKNFKISPSIEEVIVSNPKKGFEKLYESYYSVLCSHAYRFVRSKETAEDIVAEVFYNLWKTKAYLEIKTSFRAYLFQSVRNRSLNYLAYELKKFDSIEIINENKLTEIDSPDQLLMLEELNQKIEDLVSTLSPQCKKIFLMNKFEGKKNKEIASELKLSIRTVETHLFRAMNLLKNSLNNQWQFLLALSFVL